MIEIEVRLFNSLAKYRAHSLRMAAATTVGEVLARLAIPEREVYLALLNGRNIMHSLGGEVERGCRLADGDVLALSGPVPFSRGYGAPVI